MFSSGVISYYADDKMNSLKGSYSVNASSSVNSIQDVANNPYCIALQATGTNNTDTLILSTESSDQQQEFIATINQYIEDLINQSERERDSTRISTEIRQQIDNPASNITINDDKSC